MAPRLSPPLVRAPFCGRPPLPGTGQTGFSAPGWCLPSPFGSCGSAARQGLGAGPPFVPPGGGESPDGEPLRRPTRPRSSPVPSVRPGGRWAPAAASASRVPRPGRSQLSQRSRLPEGCVRHAASSASLSRRPRLSWPPPGVGDCASPESWRGPGSPELSSLGKGSRTLSMPSHVPRQVTECVSRFDGRRVGRETVPTDFEKRIL